MKKQLFYLFLRHEKQELHSAYCGRYRNDYLGFIVHLVDAGVPKSEPHGDDISASGYRYDIFHSDTFHVQIKRESRAETPWVVCLGGDVRAVFVLHFRGLRLEKHLPYKRPSLVAPPSSR